MLTLAFLWPLIALPLPLLISWLVPPTPPSNSNSIQSPAFKRLATLDHHINHPNPSAFNWQSLCLYSIWVLIILAACRPQWLGEPKPIETQARNIILAVDISGSMAQEDMSSYPLKKNRLEVVKDIITDFISQRTHDNIGLVLFGTKAYTHVPLTFDHGTLNILLQEASIGIAGKYTAIGDALGLSIKALYNTDTQLKKGLIILLTDGHSNAGTLDVLEPAQLAAQLQIKVHTIGIGSTESSGVAGFFFNNNPSADLDDKPLIKIAQLTGGKFFRATDKARLKKIYKLIDKLEPTISPERQFRPIKALYYWPLGIAMVLIVFLVGSLIQPIRQLIGQVKRYS